MSFSKSTPHFGFPQYQDNDPQSVPQWNTDITESFAKIDDVLYTSQDKADQAIGGVATATEAATNAQTAATNAETSAQEAAETVTTLRNSLVSITPGLSVNLIKSWGNSSGLTGDFLYTITDDGWYQFAITAKSGQIVNFNIAPYTAPADAVPFIIAQADAREASNPLTIRGPLYYCSKGEYRLSVSANPINSTGVYIFKANYE